MLARLRFPVVRSRGRRYPEPEHPYRNAFQRDRDRVVHSRAFRRLEAKTQVFTPGLSDHFRNRLTHTIEVAQIARTLANVLQLDEDLTEALALAHDIGHPPFAHAGEEALNGEMARSLRICSRPLTSGRPTTTRRSKRPGRSSAGSSTSGRLVAATRITPSLDSKQIG